MSAIMKAIARAIMRARVRASECRLICNERFKKGLSTAPTDGMRSRSIPCPQCYATQQL